MTSVTIGTIQTRWAKTAASQLGSTPTKVNQSRSARPSTAWGKKIGR